MDVSLLGKILWRILAYIESALGWLLSNFKGRDQGLFTRLPIFNHVPSVVRVTSDLGASGRAILPIQFTAVSILFCGQMFRTCFQSSHPCCPLILPPFASCHTHLQASVVIQALHEPRSWHCIHRSATLHIHMLLLRCLRLGARSVK